MLTPLTTGARLAAMGIVTKPIVQAGGGVSATAMARWLLDAANSGTSPTSAVDSVGDADLDFSAMFTANPTTNHWSSNGAGNGIVMNNPDDAATIASVGTSTLSWDTTTWTIELCLALTAHADAAPLFAMRVFSGLYGGVQYQGSGSARIRVYVGDGIYREYSAAGITGNTGTLHVVFDSTQATEADRIAVYYEGSPLSVAASSGTFTQNSTISWDTGTAEVWVMSKAVGTLFHAAFYAEAVSASDCATIATALASDNDADPTA